MFYSSVNPTNSPAVAKAWARSMFANRSRFPGSDKICKDR